MVALIGARDIKDFIVWARDRMEKREEKVPITESSLIIYRRATTVDVVTPIDDNKIVVGIDCDPRIVIEPSFPPYLACHTRSVKSIKSPALLELIEE